MHPANEIISSPVRLGSFFFYRPSLSQEALPRTSFSCCFCFLGAPCRAAPCRAVPRCIVKTAARRLSTRRIAAPHRAVHLPTNGLWIASSFCQATSFTEGFHSTLSRPRPSFSLPASALPPWEWKFSSRHKITSKSEGESGAEQEKESSRYEIASLIFISFDSIASLFHVSQFLPRIGKSLRCSLFHTLFTIPPMYDHRFHNSLRVYFSRFA